MNTSLDQWFNEPSKTEKNHLNKQCISNIEAFEIVKNEILWDFTDAKTQYLSHKIHSYPARFIPQIPKTFIKLFTKKGDTVLDPFMGGGTTLVEALLNKRNGIGIDFNPLAHLIANLKTDLLDSFNFENIKYNIETQEVSMNEINQLKDKLPKRKEKEYFHDDLLKRIVQIRKSSKLFSNPIICRLLDVSLSSAIFSLIDQNGRKKEIVKWSADRFYKLFLKNIRLFAKELIHLKNKVGNDKSKIEVIKGDSRKLNYIENKSVDLIVTSPPYVNALDYYRIHQYNMAVLDLDIKLFKDNEIGGHSHFINNRFRLLSEYLGDMGRTIIEMNRVLKRNKICVIVVGNSSLEYELIESHKFFSQLGEKMGFKIITSINRNIDKTKKHHSNIGKIDDEYILVMEKISDCEFESNNTYELVKVVKDLMVKFLEKLKQDGTGSSITTIKKPSVERLEDNYRKINEAISTIEEDIEIINDIKPIITTKYS